MQLQLEENKGWEEKLQITKVWKYIKRLDEGIGLKGYIDGLLDTGTQLQDKI